MPKYSSDKSWAKHQEFCKEAPLAYQAKKLCKYFADGNCREGVHCWYSHDLSNAPMKPEKRKAEGLPLTSGTIDDIPRLLTAVDKHLEGIEFSRVQLGVFDDERVTLEEPPKKKANLTLQEEEGKREEAEGQMHGDNAATDVNKGLVETRKDETVKSRVLSKLRKEFQRRHPKVEIVHQAPDLKLDFDMTTWSFKAPIFTAVLLYARLGLGLGLGLGLHCHLPPRTLTNCNPNPNPNPNGRYRKLVRDIPQTRWPCSKCSQEKTGQKGKSGKRKQMNEIALPELPLMPGEVCRACKGTGLQYQDSVQDLIGLRLVEALMITRGSLCKSIPNSNAGCRPSTRGIASFTAWEGRILMLDASV